LQVLNVALGGTLHQDVGDILADRESHWNTYHPISLDAQSRIARAMKTESPARSHSFHHQALNTIATGLHVVGCAPDGIIEAVEHVSCRWIVGVQWHPEDDAASDGEQQGLFDAFVAECRRFV
jgi:putative glutamine amidotransferase